MKNLQKFCKKVNELAQKQCDEMNKQGHLFPAVHNEFPESMLKYYFDLGISPKKTLEKINEDSGF
jgi:hypothetical protein